MRTRVAVMVVNQTIYCDSMQGLCRLFNNLRLIEPLLSSLVEAVQIGCSASLVAVAVETKKGRAGLMSVVSVILWLLAIIAILCIFFAAMRFFTLRSRGASVLMRKLPAKGFHGWRHGVLRYKGDAVDFYKLRSVWPMADHSFSRLDIELLDSRPVTDDEAAFISEDYLIFCFSSDGQGYELACTQHAMMAFGAWVEASPSQRREQIDFRRLRDRAERPRGSNMPYDPSTWSSYNGH